MATSLPVFDARDVELFHLAVEALATLENKPTANNFAVAMAALAHRQDAGRRWAVAEPPDAPLSSSELQKMCDAVWSKQPEFRPASAEGPVFKPFERSFKPLSPGSNNWRSSFNLQAGLGCDAPFDEDFLRSDTYIEQNRFECVFRDEHSALCHAAEASVERLPKCFQPAKGGDVVPSRGDMALARPKVLARSQGGSGRLDGYWLIPQTPESLSGLLASVDDRVPLYPFAMALYGGSDYWMADRGPGVTAERLASDLGLPAESFYALFDPSPSHPANAAMLAGTPNLVVGPLVTAGSPAEVATSYTSSDLPAPLLVTAEDIDVDAIKVTAGSLADPAERARLLERAVKGHQATVKALIAQLSTAGYVCSQQAGGYDLAASHALFGHYLFEVKTFSEANLTKQIRTGWAQLYEYRFRNAGLWPDPPRLLLVFDREPPTGLWLWGWLQEQLGVVPCWIDAGGKLSTFADAESLLPPIPG